MNIVIIGAGQTGRYLSQVLSNEKCNVVLVDIDRKRLEQAAWSSDIAIKQGSGTDWQLLDQFLELSPDLLVALTSDDATNLVACSIAKNLGYKKTIARVRDSRYLNRTRLDFGRLFDVDEFICPELLVANEIYKYMVTPGVFQVETFAHGAVQLRTILIPTSWRKGNVPISKLDFPAGMMVGLISRHRTNPHDYTSKGQQEIIFPHGDDTILPGDELTLIGESSVIAEVHSYFGIPERSIKSVVVLGGSRTAINLAKILSREDISLRIIEKDPNKCAYLTDLLPKATIINQDGTSDEVIQNEKLGQADAFIASTRSDEVNVMSGLLVKNVGCENVMAQLTSQSYIPIVNRLGIIHTPSPRIIAANRILAISLTEAIATLTTLYENQAEIFEIRVSSQSTITGIPIAELGPYLPKDFLIAVIQNRGRVMIANGTRVISPGDTVIVIANPKHRHELKKIF